MSGRLSPVLTRRALADWRGSAGGRASHAQPVPRTVIVVGAYRVGHVTSAKISILGIFVLVITWCNVLGFDLPRQHWSLLNRFRTEQGHWRLTDSDLCPYGETQTMSPDKTEWRLISATLCG